MFYNSFIMRFLKIKELIFIETDTNHIKKINKWLKVKVINNKSYNKNRK